MQKGCRGQVRGKPLPEAGGAAGANGADRSSQPCRGGSLNNGHAATMNGTMTDPVADAAREWLISVVDMYEGVDSGPSDPIHAARMRAKAILDTGPTASDPLLIAGMIAEALPGDERAARLALSWSDKYLEAARRTAPSLRR